MKITNDYEAFEFVKTQLLNQKEKSFNDVKDCAYRGYSTKQFEEADKYAQELFEDPLTHWIADDRYDLYLDFFASQTQELRCAIGHLINDEVYHPNIEGKILDEEVIELIRKSHTDWMIGDSSFDMMNNLQRIHDGMAVENWERAFEEMSKNFNSDGRYVATDI